MSEIAAMIPDAVHKVQNLTQANVTVGRREIWVHAHLHGVPITAEYQLKSQDPRRWRAQLAAAWRSHHQGRAVPADWQPQALNNQTLRAHALRYLTAPHRWQLRQITIAGMPVSSSEIARWAGTSSEH